MSREWWTIQNGMGKQIHIPIVPNRLDDLQYALRIIREYATSDNGSPVVFAKIMITPERENE